MNRNLTQGELSKVCEVITGCMGLHFPVERWAILGRNLASAAHEFGFRSMDEFIYWILTSELNNDHIKILASHLTISETYFWREPQVFSALTDSILPELIRSAEKREKNIRIWSAGCSTGEEAYSLAITLHKTIPKISDWNISILATDINPKALLKARSGIYGPWSFRNTPDWLKKWYFNQVEDRKFEIIPEIKNMVTFSCGSLTGNDFITTSESKLDIIFCRNVLMYFTSEWVSRISQNFFNALSDDGWLVVSSSELSSQLFPQFTPVNFPGAILYTKNKKQPSCSFDFQSEEVTYPPQHLNHSTITPLNTLTSTLIQNIKPNQPSQPVQLLNPLAVQYTSAIERTPEEISSDKLFAIRLLANQGYLPEALTLCNEAIEFEKLTTCFYFMRASILQEMGRIPEAITSLKQSIYIEPEYIMGHFTLGNLFNQLGNTSSALRHFNNALDLLRKYANDDILPESEGLSVKYIREIIHANVLTSTPH